MENRTPDLRIANATLYQLSYDPNREALCKASDVMQQGPKLRVRWRGLLNAEDTPGDIGGNALKIFWIGLVEHEEFHEL